jgi:hypothetical protein
VAAMSQTSGLGGSSQQSSALKVKASSLKE